MISYYASIERGAVIEADRLTSVNVDVLTAWCNGLKVNEIDTISHSNHVGINVPTEKGNRRASEGDYICLDMSSGRFFVLKSGAFGAAYEII